MEISCRKATLLDADYLSIHLRQSDLDEIAAGSGGVPRDILRRAVLTTDEVYTLCADGLPMGMFGVTRAEFSYQGYVWFLGTSTSVDKRLVRAWLSLGPAILKFFLAYYPSLTNRVWKGNVKHIRWLKSMHAQMWDDLDDPAFYQFVITRKSHV